MARYARGMWDFQTARYNYAKRTNGLASTPATIPVSRFQDGAKDPDIRLNEFWYNFVQALNPPESKRFITAPHTGWVNDEWVEGLEYPYSEAVVMSGNALLITETSEKFGRIDCYDFKVDTPDPALDNYFNTPWRIQKFSVIAERNTIRNPGKALDAYYPVLRAGHSLWVPLDRIEFFPELPMAVTIEVPTRVQQPLGTATEQVLPKGQIVTVQEYALRGSSVWGAIDAGWIPLQVNGLFSPTSWSMKTPPALAPKDAPGLDSEPSETPPGEFDVTVTAIRTIVRQTPGGSKVGEMVYGRKAHVFQKASRQGKSWLRVGEKRWITEQGTKRT